MNELEEKIIQELMKLGMTRLRAEHWMISNGNSIEPFGTCIPKILEKGKGAELLEFLKLQVRLKKYREKAEANKNKIENLDTKSAWEIKYLEELPEDAKKRRRQRKYYWKNRAKILRKAKKKRALKQRKKRELNHEDRMSDNPSKFNEYYTKGTERQIAEDLLQRMLEDDI